MSRGNLLCLGVTLNMFHLLLLQIPSTFSSCRVCCGAQSFLLGELLVCSFWTERSDVGTAVFWGGLAGLLLRLFTLSLGGLTRNGPITGRLLCPSSGACLPWRVHSSSRLHVSAMASSPGSLIATCSDLCISIGIVAPSSFGVGPSCSALRARDDWSLRDRLLTAVSARKLGCDKSCVLCGAATGDLFRCLTVCPIFSDPQWCHRCSISPESAAAWIRHPWLRTICVPP